MYNRISMEYINIYDLIKYLSIKNIICSLGLFILGFLPWSFSFLWIIGSRYKDIINSIFSYFRDNSQNKLNEKWKKLKKTEKFLSLNSIVFFSMLIFAVLYGIKYTYLILILMFPASCLSGYFWYEYMYRKQRDKSIFFATFIPNILFIVCSFIALFGHDYINKLTIYGFNFLVIPLIIIFFLIPLISIFSVILKGRIPAFLANIILMISLSFVLTPGIFNFITLNGGESDLIEFADRANHDKVKLYSFMNSQKYSLMYYYDGDIEYRKNIDYEWLRKLLIENQKDYIITEIKNLWKIEEKNIKYMILDSGNRYCLIKYLPEVMEKAMEQEKEPEIIIN